VNPRPASGALPWWQRLTAALVGGAVFVDAARRTHGPTGLSTFGRPPELSTLWATLALVTAVVLAASADRLTLARRLALLLLCCCLFGGQAVPCAPEFQLALLGLTLVAAAPALIFGWRQAATLAALGCALPGALASSYPQASLDWLCAVLPPAGLVFVLPALFAAGHARRAALMLVSACGLLACASLLTYHTLAEGLDLDLTSLLSTRLRPLGMHPNLAVPQLATALVLGCALLWDRTERRRPWVAVALLPLLLALVAVQSKTGLIVAAAGLLLLALKRLPEALARRAHLAACVLVAAALLFPVLGSGRERITADTPTMTSKAVSFRSAMWELGRRTLLAAPWCGFGPGNSQAQTRFAEASRYDGLPQDDHLHNVVLAVGVGLGWPGLLGLAALLVSSFRAGGRRRLVGDAASAALLATWAANSIDMGGAVNSLYPSLVLVLLGLHTAAETAPHRLDLQLDPGRRVALLIGLLCLVAGLTGAGGRLLVERLEAVLPPADADGLLSAEIALHEPALRAELDNARRLRPLDPHVELLGARLAANLGARDEQLRCLTSARRLDPESPDLMYREALLLSRSEPASPRVRELLEEAVRMDPLGPDAWRVLVDLAVVLGGHGEAEPALAALVQALLLNPEAIRHVSYRSADDSLLLGWPGVPGSVVPMARVFLELTRERAARGASDPATELRLRLREVEVLMALGAWERADAACERLLAGSPVYLHLRLALSAAERGEHAEALAHFVAIPGEFTFQIKVSELVARAESEPLDEAAFLALSEELDERMPDVSFEGPTLVRLLGARRRFAERRLQPEAALALADAIAFASR